ncbi:NAD(P)-dependent oxidoreductase [Escherichia coli]
MHTPTVLTETVADTLMALVLSTARRVVEVAERVKAGEWTASIGPDWYGTDVHHKHWALSGWDGSVWRSHNVRTLASTCPSSITRAATIKKQKNASTPATAIWILVTRVRFGLPYPAVTNETHHLFGAEQFAKMKSSAIFINAGRGPVVDENPLIVALQKGEIHAAGLDVFEQEPLSVEFAVALMANVVAVPHIGSATHETRYGMAACAVDNLIDALQGKVEKNGVNPHVAD